MSLAAIILGLVTLQRLGELLLSRRNVEKLKARGGIEVGGDHYPLIVAMHASWLLALCVFGWDQPVNGLALTAYVAVQGLRLWVLVSLGGRWSTRIVVLPGEPLVARGLYRYIAHPNYAVVVAEIALLPLALHLPLVALFFTMLNAAVLAIRIRVESRALVEASGARARG